MNLRHLFLLAIAMPLVGCQPVDPQGNPNQPQGKSVPTNIVGQPNPNFALANTVWDHKGPYPRLDPHPDDPPPADNPNNAQMEFEKHYGAEFVVEQDKSDFKAGETVQYMDPVKGPQKTDPKVKILDPMDGRYAKILDHEKNGDEIETYIRSELLYRPITSRPRFWNRDTNQELTLEAYEKARREFRKAAAENAILPPAERALQKLEAARRAAQQNRP